MIFLLVAALIVGLLNTYFLRSLMATYNDVTTKFQAIMDGVAELALQIADLKAQVAAGSVITQAQLDALDVSAQAVIDAVEAAK